MRGYVHEAVALPAGSSAAPSCRNLEVDEGQQEVGLLGGRHEIAGQCERDTEPGDRAVHCGDGGLRYRAELEDDRVVHRFQAGVEVGPPG